MRRHPSTRQIKGVDGVFGSDARWVVLLSCGGLSLVLALGAWQLLHRRSRHLPAELWLAGLALLGLGGLGMGLFLPLATLGLQWIGPAATLGSVICQALALQAIGGRRSRLDLWLTVLLVYLTLYQALSLAGWAQLRAAVTVAALIGAHLWIARCAHVLAWSLHSGPARLIRHLALATALLFTGWLVLRVSLDLPLMLAPDPWPLIVVAGASTLFAVTSSLAFGELVLDELRRAERQSADHLQRELGRREGMARMQEALERARLLEQSRTASLALLAHEVARPLADARQALEQLRRAPAERSLDQPWWLVDEPLRQALAALDVRVLPQLLGEQCQRLPMVVCDPGRLLQEAVGDLPPQQRARVQLDLPVRPLQLPSVAYLLRLALVQLLRHALQHGPAAAPVRVQLRPVFGADGVKILLRDGGPGFPPSWLQTCRDGDPAVWTAVGQPGAGQGLSLVARIAWLLGGRLVLENVPGVGGQAALLLSTIGPAPTPPAGPGR